MQEVAPSKMFVMFLCLCFEKRVSELYTKLAEYISMIHCKSLQLTPQITCIVADRCVAMWEATKKLNFELLLCPSMQPKLMGFTETPSIERSGALLNFKFHMLATNKLRLLVSCTFRKLVVIGVWVNISLKVERATIELWSPFYMFFFFNCHKGLIGKTI